MKAKAPSAFMTDNSRPEKDALHESWPSARQLRCHFHVLQAEWRWITAARNNVAKEDRRLLITAFQKVLYARDDAALQTTVTDLLTLGHRPHIQRVQSFLQCQQEWVLLYRTGL